MLTDLPAERATLAGICKYGGNAWIDCRELINDDCFSDHVNQLVFTCLERIFANNNNTIVDLASILSAAQEVGLRDISESNNIKYIKALFQFHVEETNVREFARKIRKLSEFRQLLGSLDSTASQIKQLTGNESISEAIALAEKPIFDLTNKLVGGSQQTEQMGVGIDDYYTELYNNLDVVNGVPVGWPIYEQAVGGLHTGVHVIGARKKTGKSMLALNAALWSSFKEKNPTIYLDTELHREHGQWHRFSARLGNGLTIDEIKYGSFLEDEDKVKKFEKAKNILKKIPLEYRNVSGLGVDEILSIMRRWLIQRVGYNSKGRLNKCLIVYDYLKPPTDIKSLKDLQETQEIGLRMGKLHEFTVQYSVPILTFSQLNRDQDIAASDRVSWYCTSYSSFRAKDIDEITHDGPQNGNRRLTIEDVRHGEGLDGGDYINFHFDGKYALMKELKTRNQVEADKKNVSGDD